MTPPVTLTAIVQEAETALASVSGQLDWAEDEIRLAQSHHARHADTLYHSFTLLRPTSARMSTEFVYRSHCRELLDRVAAGHDTRPGTAAEVCCVCADISRVTPMNTAATGLYFRMWAQAFPGQRKPSDTLPHYEAIAGPKIDSLEALARQKLAVSSRRLGIIECSGRHDTEPVRCAYALVTR